MAFINMAAPRTDLVIGPAVSWLGEMGTMPSCGITPTVGLKPTRPLTLEGQMIEPLVSVPTPPAAREAAMAAPVPELEPQGLRSSMWGLRTCPPTEDQPLIEKFERKLAHWLRLVLPRITAPCARRPATRGLSRPVMLSFRAVEPAVVGIGSRVSILSL